VKVKFKARDATMNRPALPACCVSRPAEIHDSSRPDEIADTLLGMMRFSKGFCWSVAAGILSLLASGCETIGQDLGDVTSALHSVKPSEAAVMMMDPYDADNRRLGTVLISNSTFGGVDVYVKAYRDMVLNEHDPIVKAMAIRALGRHGQPEDATRILPNLHHESVQVRWESAKALQRLHNPAAVNDLLRVLRNDREQSDVRIAAATALGQYSEDRVFQGLIAALDVRELAVNRAAERSLHTLTSQSLGLNSSVWLSWYNQQGSSSAAFAKQSDYVYPTYERDQSLLERLAFWTTRNFEQPAPPAGLRPSAERTTYDDADGPTPESNR
jgi:hypothetical protein